MSSPRRFDTAPMALVFWVVTGFVLAIPIGFAFIGMRVPIIKVPMLAAAGSIVLLSILTWLLGRPTGFEVDDDGLTVVWPLSSRAIAYGSIKKVRVLTKQDTDQLFAGAMRVGVGGLFGVFGLLKTRELGWVSCYITKIEPLLLVELDEGRPLLISPADPEAVAAALRR